MQGWRVESPFQVFEGSLGFCGESQGINPLPWTTLRDPIIFRFGSKLNRGATGIVHVSMPIFDPQPLVISPWIVAYV